MADDRGLIFLHIPKAAGSTLRSVIKRQYPRHTIHKLYGPHTLIDRFINLPEPSRREIRVLQGHIPFGLHKYMLVPVDYLTMLRDPVDRVISLYYWIRETRASTLHELVKGMSLSHFAGSGFAITSNYQTSLLSGLMSDSEEALAAAKNNLELPHTTFGLKERFDESLILFRNVLGWKRVYYSRRNVTGSRPGKQEVSDDVIRTIEQHNRADIDLYNFARQRFDEIIGDQGPSFQDEVRSFQRLSSIYGKFDVGLNVVQRVVPPHVRTAFKKGLRIFRTG